MIRKALIIIGLEGKKYGAHSLRAGGATDLFRAGVYYPLIKKFGRWKSDTALIYYRDQEAVTETVMTAFRSLSNLTK
jgi:integrase